MNLKTLKTIGHETIFDVAERIIVDLDDSIDRTKRLAEDAQAASENSISAAEDAREAAEDAQEAAEDSVRLLDLLKQALLDFAD